MPSKARTPATTRTLTSAESDERIKKAITALRQIEPIPFTRPLGEPGERNDGFHRARESFLELLEIHYTEVRKREAHAARRRT